MRSLMQGDQGMMSASICRGLGVAWIFAITFATANAQPPQLPPLPDGNRELGVTLSMSDLPRDEPPAASQEKGGASDPAVPATGEDNSEAAGEYAADDSVQFAAAYRSAPSAASRWPEVRLTGFFQADAAWFSQSALNRTAVGDIQDGADFRRARLAGTGKAWDNVAYMLEMDFAFPGRPSFMDVWLEVEDAPLGGKLRVGQYRQPFGMDGQTGVKDLTFIERSLPFAFLPFRQIGAMLHGQALDDEVTWAISGFRFPTDVYGGNVGDDGGYGLATRTTGLLIDRHHGSVLMHVGSGFSYIDPANDQFRYSSQPEVFVQEVGGGVPPGVPGVVPPFVDTGTLTADNARLFNAELATVLGSLHTQTELFYAQVDQSGGPMVTLPGVSTQIGYFLTGEVRPYDHAAGVFGRIQPLCSVGRQGGLGAVEIAARYSYLDFNDQNILGGRLNNWTAGVNWYLNPHTKFQLNYIYSDLNTPGLGRNRADTVVTRAQLDF
ncbi:MAG: porin [Planctomycetota bacterium]|nr:MAG: porin [Planctomycetota bacterium]